MRVTRHDAAVSRQNVLRMTADECDDTSRLFIAHRKAADCWHQPGRAASLPESLSLLVDGMVNEITRNIAHHWDILDNFVNKATAL